MYNFTTNIDLVKVMVEEHHADLLREAEINRLLQSGRVEEKQVERREPLRLFERVRHGVARAIAIAF